ncbi:hypothetical protein AB2B38_006700 [Balneola sp. MJW-20]|uniref:hypothetical protein n=1 Tax=Gracilimonas aurantiaca TaxID=3234185 RepID=UPI0034650370
MHELSTLNKRKYTVMAFCLMKDNSHIILRRKGSEVSQSHLPDWSGSWKKADVIINLKYLRLLIAYVHRLPVEHGISTNFQTYPYTSFTDILYNRKSMISVSDVLKLYGSREYFLEMHRAVLQDLYLERIEFGS